MNNYLKNTANSYNRINYENAKHRDENNSVGSMDEDKTLISGLKVMSVVLAVSICGVGLSKCVLNKNDKVSTRNNTTIEEYDNNYVGTAVISMNGNATIVELESYTKTEDGSEIILTTTDGGNLIIDSDSVVVIDGENSHDVAYDLAATMIDENGQVTEYGKNKGPVKKLTL